MKSESEFHTPVLLKPALEYLDIKPGKVYIDATVGGGGHSIEILKKGGRVFGIDCDSEAVEFAQKRLAHFCSKNVCPLNAFSIIQANFVQLKEIFTAHKISNPAGALFDLGTSLHQLKTRGRGFSFLTDEPLDMRMDKKLKVTAADLVNGLSAKELDELFDRLGEEKYSRAIANNLVRARRQKAVRNTRQLAEIAQAVYRKYKQRGKIHPATKIFQTLRIAVNDELNNLRQGLPQAVDCLGAKGKLVVISFHGLEDRIVKNFLREEEGKGTLKILTKKPLRPGFEEQHQNPRARSARLRAAEKI